MEQLIYLTDNLLANLLQKLKETKEELMVEIKKEGLRVEAIVNQLRQDVLAGKGGSLSGSGAADSLNSSVKLLGFDFQFMKERLVQVQRTFDSRMMSLEEKQSGVSRQVEETNFGFGLLSRVDKIM